MLRFDLQSHSIHSDGTLPAGDVVRLAAAAGIELLALSDHDTVDGTQEALAAARESGIGLVTAVEVSAIDPPHEELHVLGYGVDHTDPVLLAALAGFRADRGLRADRMAAALERAGWAVAPEALAARRAADEPIGRPHLAEAAHGHPANAARVVAEGLATSTDFLVAYLIPGAPAYVGRERPTIAEAVAAIHAAGGLAVWAHPFWDLDDPEAVLATLERFAGIGIDGVEAFYVTHDAAQTRLLHAAAMRLGLQTTGSADFHGPRHPSFARFGAFERYGLEPALDRIEAAAR